MAAVMIKLSSSRIFKPPPQVTKQTPQQFVWVKWCSNKADIPQRLSNTYSRNTFEEGWVVLTILASSLTRKYNYYAEF
jgi:hypothetical protein